MEAASKPGASKTLVVPHALTYGKKASDFSSRFVSTPPVGPSPFPKPSYSHIHHPLFFPRPSLGHHLSPISPSPSSPSHTTTFPFLSSLFRRAAFISSFPLSFSFSFSFFLVFFLFSRCSSAKVPHSSLALQILAKTRDNGKKIPKIPKEKRIEKGK